MKRESSKRESSRLDSSERISDEALLEQTAAELLEIIESPNLKAAFSLYYTGFVVNRLINILSGRYGPRHRVPVDVLTVLAVHNGTLLPSELARMTVRSRQIISHVIENLERDGLVKRESVGEDRRTRGVTITRKGVETLQQELPRFRYLRDNIAPVLCDEEIDALLRHLRQIRKRAYAVSADSSSVSEDES